MSMMTHRTNQLQCYQVLSTKLPLLLDSRLDTPTLWQITRTTPPRFQRSVVDRTPTEVPANQRVAVYLQMNHYVEIEPCVAAVCVDRRRSLDRPVNSYRTW